MALTLTDARGLSDEILEVLRLRAIHACELGYSQADVAAVLGVAAETVCRWWAAYIGGGGADALPGDRTGRPVGSGRTLSDEQGRRTCELIDGYSPEALGGHSPLWSRRAVGELIRRAFGIVMPVRTVGEYLKRWGYTAKSPRRHARRQDPEELRRWLEVTYPSIAARAEREGADIYWGATRPAWRPTSIPDSATPAAANRRRWKSPTRTSASIRSRRSATRGGSAS